MLASMKLIENETVIAILFQRRMTSGCLPCVKSSQGGSLVGKSCT